MDQQTNFIHCGGCAVFSAFHWRTVLDAPAHSIPKPVIFQQHPSGSSRNNVCSWVSRLPLARSPRNLAYLPTSSQQCVPRERKSARFTVHLTASQMQSAQRSIVKLRETVGGVYSHRPLVVAEAPHEAVSSLPSSVVLCAAAPRALMWFNLTRAHCLLGLRQCLLAINNYVISRNYLHHWRWKCSFRLSSSNRNDECCLFSKKKKSAIVIFLLNCCLTFD